MTYRHGAMTTAETSDLNMWGTPRSWVGVGHCPECEREESAWGTRQHYITCPLHPHNADVTT